MINSLIVRIQNLLPDTCRICETEYCTELGGKTIISCSICGQAAHNECIAQKLGMDRELLEDLGPEEALSRINPFGLPGFHYLCGPCEENTIPSTEAGKRRKRKNTLNPDQEDSILQHANHEPAARDALDDRTIPPSQMDPVDPATQPESGESTSPAGETDVTPGANGTGNRNTNATQQAPHQQHGTQGVCSYFRRGTCRYGMSGRGCPKQHPKACRKLILHGDRRPRGCDKGNSCENFHPKMCRQSLIAGECLTMDCKLRHVAGSRRTTSKGKKPTPQSP